MVAWQPVHGKMPSENGGGGVSTRSSCFGNPWAEGVAICARPAAQTPNATIANLVHLIGRSIAHAHRSSTVRCISRSHIV
jgi:hypothetical protein